MNEQTTVAVIGTGTMGAPMAANLASSGLDVRVWNRSREKAEPLADRGADIADSPADAAAGADVVLTVLADGGAGERDERGARGSRRHGGRRRVAADEHRGDRRHRALAQPGRAARRAFVDAPVLGTRKPAEQGELIVLAAGPDAVRERCAPVFDAVGREVRWVGLASRGASRASGHRP